MQEYERMRSQAVVAEEHTRDKAKLVEKKMAQVEEKKVCCWCYAAQCSDDTCPINYKDVSLTGCSSADVEE